MALLEALVATAMLAGGALSLGYAVLAAGRVHTQAQQSAIVSVLARDKLEALRALAWVRDDAVAAAGATGVVGLSSIGVVDPGLALSPPGSARTNTSGYCDFFDARGWWIGSGVVAPPGAVWARRWSISAVSGMAEIVQVEVVVVPVRAGMAAGRRMRSLAGSRLLAFRTRRTR